jgi:hypothetical protein
MGGMMTGGSRGCNAADHDRRIAGRTDSGDDFILIVILFILIVILFILIVIPNRFIVGA